MKKRHLRTWIRNLLEAITIIMLLLLAGLEDFSMGAIPYIFGYIGVILLNIYILEKY